MRTILIFICIISALLSKAQSWSYVGPCCIEANVDNLSSAGSEDLDFLSDGTPVVSYFRQTGGSTTGKVKQFNGSGWEQLGTDFPAEGTISAIDLETHNAEIYASVLFNATQIRLYHYTNNEWSQLGDMITGNLAYDFLIDNLGELYVFTTTDQSIRKYNGSAWDVILSLSESTSPIWGGDQTIVVDGNNQMIYVQPFLNTQTFTFENSLHAFNGSGVSPMGGIFYAGLGNPGKPGISNAVEVYAQYQSNSTNKICRLDGDVWTQLLDTTNAVNGIFGFKYTFNAEDQLVLSVMTNVYLANNYTPLTPLPTEGIAVLINDMVLAPDGKIYVSFGEIPSGGGMNFSVMVFDSGNSVEEENTFSFEIYPNPADESFHIAYANAGDILSLHDLQGRIMLNTSITATSVSNFTHTLPNGSYCVTIQRGQKFHSKIIHIQHP